MQESGYYAGVNAIQKSQPSWTIQTDKVRSGEKEMTPEQRKRVAELTTGEKWRIEEWRPVNPEYNCYHIIAEKAVCSRLIFWDPKFDGDERQRSQALAVAEKAAELIDQYHEEDWLDANAGLVGMIKRKDMETLLSLVLELSE